MCQKFHITQERERVKRIWKSQSTQFATIRLEVIVGQVPELNYVILFVFSTNFFSLYWWFGDSVGISVVGTRGNAESCSSFSVIVLRWQKKLAVSWFDNITCLWCNRASRHSHSIRENFDLHLSMRITRKWVSKKKHWERKHCKHTHTHKIVNWVSVWINVNRMRLFSLCTQTHTHTIHKL